MRKYAATLTGPALILFIAAAPLAAQKTPGNASSSANNAVMSQVRALDQKEKTDLQNLSRQMTDLRQMHQNDVAPLDQQLSSLNAGFQSAMKSLQDQYETTHHQFGEQRAMLLNLIKPGYLALYQQEQQSLANLKSEEDQAAQSLRQQEDSELQAVREKYDAQRKDQQQQYAAQRRSIDSQFEADVKASK